MLKEQSVFNTSSNMWTDCLYCMTAKVFFVLAFFNIEKFTNEAMMIFVASQHFKLYILYGIYDLLSFWVWQSWNLWRWWSRMMMDRTQWAETAADQLAWSAVAPLRVCALVRSSYSSEKYYVLLKHDIIYLSFSQFR